MVDFASRLLGKNNLSSSNQGKDLNDFSLTPHQKTVVEQGLEYLKEVDVLILQGKAGTGKTYSANALVAALLKQRSCYDEVVIAAPTHDAVTQIKDKFDSGADVAFATIHSTMKYRKVRGKFQPKFRAGQEPLRDVGILVVDECSMLAADMVDNIENYAELSGCKVIFIGDNAQLPPVGANTSPVFERGYAVVEFMEVVRQKYGSSIITLSRNLQLALSGVNDTKGSKKSLSGYVFCNDEKYIVKRLAEGKGKEPVRFIAYTNAKVNSINKKVRKEIYGRNPAQLEIGETVAFKSNYRNLYTTNQRIEIKSAKEVTVEVIDYTDDGYPTISLKAYSVNKEDFASNQYLCCLTDKHQKVFDDICRELFTKCIKREEKWSVYEAYAEQFCQLKYVYAGTIHTAQGSTHEITIVDVGGIMACNQEKIIPRMMYTAVTRPSRLLILHNI